MLDNDDTIGKSERPSLYKTQRWRQLRQRRLTVEPHCRMCAKMGLRERAVIVDHIKPWKGDLVLFYMYANTQSLCKLHHDGLKKSNEYFGYDKTMGADGWPVDAQHPFNKASRNG